LLAQGRRQKNFRGMGATKKTKVAKKIPKNSSIKPLPGGPTKKTKYSII